MGACVRVGVLAAVRVSLHLIVYSSVCQKGMHAASVRVYEKWTVRPKSMHSASTRVCGTGRVRQKSMHTASVKVYEKGRARQKGMHTASVRVYEKWRVRQESMHPASVRVCGRGKIRQKSMRIRCQRAGKDFSVSTATPGAAALLRRRVLVMCFELWYCEDVC